MKLPSEEKRHLDFYEEEARNLEKINKKQVDFLEERNKKYMNNVALTFDENEKLKITYEELHTRIDEYARSLYKRGIREGDLVALALGNTPEGVMLMYALNKLGAVTCPVHPLQNEYKMYQDLDIIKPKWFIGINDSYKVFKKANVKADLDIDVILYSPIASIDNSKLHALYGLKQLISGNMLLSSNNRLSKVLKNGKDYENVVFPEYKEGKISDVMFTGGSTGTHKGIDLENDGLNNVVRSLDYVLSLEDGESFLGNLPLNLAFGKLAMHYALCKNTTVKLTLRALPQDFKDELYRLKPNGAMGGPIHWETLINSIINSVEGEKIDFSSKGNHEEYLSKLEKSLKEKDLSSYDLSWLKMPVSGGEQLKRFSEEAANTIFRTLGCNEELFNGLGMTEMWAPVSVKRGKLDKTGTVGVTIPINNHKVIDPNTYEELGYNEVGLYCVNGPGMMLGCHNNPEETDKVIFEDENGVKWLSTGDMVKILPTGETVYVDRLKRCFVCGCENIYPQQIENMLSEFPEIKEIVVTKIPNSDYQYLPKYHISLRDENCNQESLKQKIEQKISSTLGDSFVARYYEFYNEPLPKTANGKMNFQVLQAKDNEIEHGKVRVKTK